MLKKIAVEKVGHWIANAPQCSRCEVAVPSMRSLCHLNNRYAIVSLVTYSLIYRYPYDLWKVQLSPVPTSAILCCDRSDLWIVLRMLWSQHKIADVGKGLTIWSLQTLIGSIYSDHVAISNSLWSLCGRYTRSQMWERGFNVNFFITSGPKVYTASVGMNGLNQHQFLSTYVTSNPTNCGWLRWT